MDGLNTTLVVIMLIIIIVGGIMYFGPRKYRYTYMYPTVTYIERVPRSYVKREVPTTYTTHTTYTYIPGEVEYIPGRTEVYTVR
jgi:hypothetical protein